VVSNSSIKHFSTARTTLHYGRVWLPVIAVNWKWNARSYRNLNLLLLNICSVKITVTVCNVRGGFRTKILHQDRKHGFIQQIIDRGTKCNIMHKCTYQTNAAFRRTSSMRHNKPMPHSDARHQCSLVGNCTEVIKQVFNCHSIP
jgi:hypothetical protein